MPTDAPETDPSPSGNRVENRTHYTQGGLSTGGAAPSFGALLPAFLPHLLFFVVVMLVVVMDRSWLSWVPPIARYVVATIAVLLILIFSGRTFIRAYRRINDISGLPMALDEHARINLTCWKDQKLAYEKLSDEAFEPEQFRVAMPDKRRQQSPFFQPAVLLQCFFLPAMVAGRSTLGWIVIGVFWMLGALALVWLYRKPTYLRIYPGVLEIRRYPPFGRGKPEIDRIDLRTNQIRLDLKRGVAHVGPWSLATIPTVSPGQRTPLTQPEGVTTVHLWATFGRGKIAETIYRAAISTAVAPEHEAE